MQIEPRRCGRCDHLSYQHTYNGTTVCIVSDCDCEEFVCPTCDGDGYTETFNDDQSDVIVTLCPDCVPKEAI